MMVKRTILGTIYALVLGGMVGAVVWGFIRVMKLGILLVWELGPETIQIPGYTVVVCLVGGVVIGLWRKKFGDYPESLETVITRVKKEGKYPYRNLPQVVVAALLPLIFGASVGMEAGLTAIVAGLCSWVGDRFKRLFHYMKEVTAVGISATLGAIFNAPLFGFMEEVETEDFKIQLPKSAKTVLYFSAIAGAFLVLVGLRLCFGQEGGLMSFSDFSAGAREWVWFLPISVIGVILGIFSGMMGKLTGKIAKSLKKYPVMSSVLAGLILGCLGTILPMVMFDGEEQMRMVAENWQKLSAGILILTAIIKLIVMNSCVSLGMMGGKFFPSIFSGVCMGYGLGFLVGVNPVFAACAVAAALVAVMTRKPLATVMLLLICFSVSGVLVMILAALMGSMVGKWAEKKQLMV